jgi:hypothetical protein
MLKRKWSRSRYVSSEALAWREQLPDNGYKPQPSCGWKWGWLDFSKSHEVVKEANSGVVVIEWYSMDLGSCDVKGVESSGPWESVAS